MTILDKINAAKRREIAQRQAQVPETVLRRRAEMAAPPRDFFAALRVPGQVQIIAEVKKASPSAGVLRADFDPVAIARTYAAHGAAAVSVLTDEPFFQGKLSFLSNVRETVTLPVLRKDFLLDPYQIVEARAAGADAVLLIAECLEGEALPNLLREAGRWGMHALVELYDPDNLPRVIDAGAKIIGINNRDLRSFVTRLEHTLELAEQVPDACVLVSESGIRSRADIERLQRGGVDAVLIGETLMRSPDIGAKLRELLGVPDA